MEAVKVDRRDNHHDARSARVKPSDHTRLNIFHLPLSHIIIQYRVAL